VTEYPGALEYVIIWLLWLKRRSRSMGTHEKCCMILLVARYCIEISHSVYWGMLNLWHHKSKIGNTNQHPRWIILLDMVALFDQINIQRRAKGHGKEMGLSV